MHDHLVIAKEGEAVTPNPTHKQTHIVFNYAQQTRAN